MPMRLAIASETWVSPEDQSWLGSAHGTNTGDSVTLDGDAFLSTWPSGVVPSGVVLAKRTSDGKYVPYVGTTEKQRITVDATAGNFTLTVEGDVTPNQAFNVSAANLQAALEALPSIAVGDVLVTGGPGNAGGTTPYFVEFLQSGQFGDNPPQMTATGVGLTGGAATVTMATTQTAPTDGSQVARGILYTTVELGPKNIATPTAAQVGDTPAALLWHCEIIVSKLPANSGWDSRAALDLPQVRTQ